MLWFYKPGVPTTLRTFFGACLALFSIFVELVKCGSLQFTYKVELVLTGFDFASLLVCLLPFKFIFRFQFLEKF